MRKLDTDEEEAHLKTVVCPRAEFHFAFLVVEREPSDVDSTGALEYPGRHEQTRPVASYHNIRLERPVKAFVGATKK